IIGVVLLDLAQKIWPPARRGQESRLIEAEIVVMPMLFKRRARAIEIGVAGRAASDGCCDLRACSGRRQCQRRRRQRGFNDFHGRLPFEKPCRSGLGSSTQMRSATACALSPRRRYGATMTCTIASLLASLLSATACNESAVTVTLYAPGGGVVA